MRCCLAFFGSNHDCRSEGVFDRRAGLEAAGRNTDLRVDWDRERFFLFSLNCIMFVFVYIYFVFYYYYVRVVLVLSLLIWVFWYVLFSIFFSRALLFPLMCRFDVLFVVYRFTVFPSVSLTLDNAWPFSVFRLLVSFLSTCCHFAVSCYCCCLFIIGVI